MKMCNCVKRDEISQEWDRICEKRQSIIEKEQDISLLTVTGPCMLRNVKEERPEKLLDVGCGTGYLTERVSAFAGVCWGIDVSGRSIEIAKSKYETTGLRFEQCGIKEFDMEHEFDVCMANMVFMTDPEWELSAKRIYELLKPGGALCVMITHPCFWPKYWGYDQEEWFDYKQEIFIRHDFSISMVKSIGQTTHIHRPLATYVQTLLELGYTIEKMEEPYPVGEVPEEYAYPYPRFLFLKCRKGYMFADGL